MNRATARRTKTNPLGDSTRKSVREADYVGRSGSLVAKARDAEFEEHVYFKKVPKGFQLLAVRFEVDHGVRFRKQSQRC